MESGSKPPYFQLDLDAIRARSTNQIFADLALAKRRLIEAERAYAHLQLQHTELTKANANLSVEKASLAREKTALSNENSLLLRRISELVIQIAEADGRDRQLELTAELSQLQRRLDRTNQSLYGTKSERRPPSDRATKGKDKKRTKRTKKSGATRTAQAKLPVETVHHKLSDEQTQDGCRQCDGTLVDMGQTEDAELVDVQPIRYVLQVHHRHKYRCNCCGWISTAPGPDKLVQGGRYSPAFGVQVAVDKYADALPLSRQVTRMRRAGLQVTSQTLWDQLRYLYLLLLPTLLVLHKRVLEAEVCVADETPWRLMFNKGGGSKKWWLWTVSDGVGVYFQLVTSRGASAARELLQDFSGTLVTDDYIVYTSLEKARTRNGGVQMVLDEEGHLVEIPTPDYRLATCWMHARRYLFKAEKHHPEAGPALDLIAELYRIEELAVAEVDVRIARAVQPVSASDAREWLLDARRTLRDTRSRRCVKLLDAWRGDVVRLEGTALAEAVDHLDRLWTRLLIFLDDPRVPLDSGHAERQIRGPIVGRNNYRGCRSEYGARVAALFFSLISTAKCMGLDPHAYLLAVVTKALRDPKTVFTPWDYADQIADAAKVEAENAKADAGKADAASGPDEKPP